MASAGSVLLIVENLPVPFDRRVWMEATTLRDAGYDVAVICPTSEEYPARRERREGVEIYRHPLPTEGSSTVGYLREYLVAVSWELRLALQVARERPIDVVHICNPPDLLFLVALAVKSVTGARIVFDQHDLGPELYEAKYGRRDGWYAMLRVAERVTYAVADYVIATNESYREVAISRGRKPDDRVVVVRSGPDLRRFNAEPGDEAAFRKGRRYLVGYVGVMGEQEGIDLLLHAVRHVVVDRDRRNVQFMLIGSGPALRPMQRMADDLGLQEWVEFTGRVPERELLARLSSCDICVNADPKNPFNDRSTMNKVLEYMALGKPVVQFDLLEGRRSAADASVYVPANDPVALGDAIVSLLDDPERRRDMGNVGRRRMEERFEWRHQVPHLLEVYRGASRRERVPALG